MNLTVSGIVGGVNDHNSTVNMCLCRWLGSRISAPMRDLPVLAQPLPSGILWPRLKNCWNLLTYGSPFHLTRQRTGIFHTFCCSCSMKYHINVNCPTRGFIYHHNFFLNRTLRQKVWFVIWPICSKRHKYCEDRCELSDLLNVNTGSYLGAGVL